MRDVKRLDDFYDKLKSLHKEFPDIRFGQLINNFEGWLQKEKGYRDIFYIEEDKFIKLLEEYLKTWR